MSNKGFTLIELMIVIAIIGILSAVSTYGWLGYQNNVNLKTAAREVMADIASCRQLAVSGNCDYLIQFTDSSPNYTITAPTCVPPPPTQTKNLTSFGSGLTITTTTFGTAPVSFISRGTSSFGTINLKNSKNSTATITINITGRTYVSFAMQ
jgi:prepilin-type N-terminal cleavage/methylation domain-containing protein